MQNMNEESHANFCSLTNLCFFWCRLPLACLQCCSCFIDPHDQFACLVALPKKDFGYESTC